MVVRGWEGRGGLDSDGVEKDEGGDGYGCEWGKRMSGKRWIVMG